MGPRLMSRGKQCLARCGIQNGASFNGAAAHEPRKDSGVSPSTRIIVELQWGRGS